MLPGLLLRRPLLTAHLLSDAALQPATYPLKERRATYARGVLDEGPELHATDKAREDVGEVEMHEAEYGGVYNPHHHDGECHEPRLSYGAPRLAALQVPALARALSLGTRGEDTRNKVDRDKEHRRGYKRGYGAEHAHECYDSATNILEQYFHR